MSARTPDWLVERIALGELPPEKLAKARAALLAEPDGAARLAEVEASSRAVLAAHPTETVITEVRRRAEAARRMEQARLSLRRPGVRWGAPLAALIAAAAVLLVVRPGAVTTGDDGRIEDRLKGLEPQLVVHRRTAQGATTLLKAGDTARPGDTLQLHYVPADRPYGVILSLDGAGAVTLHLPADGSGRAAELQPQGAPLPSSFELDAAPGFERFFFITSSQPFDVETARSAAAALARDGARARHDALSLPAGLHQTSFLVRKEFLQ